MSENVRAKASYLAYRGLGTAMQRIPELMASTAAAGVAEVMARRRGLSRQMAERHMRRVIASGAPGLEPDERVVRRLATEAFREYARYWVDGARLAAVPPLRVCQRMIMESGFEHLQRQMAAGRGVVLALPHVGSWEWGGSYLNHQGFPMTSVAERVEPSELFDWFVAQRRAMGLVMVPPDGHATSRLLKTLRSGGLVGLLCDRDVMGNGVEVDFFGERTTLPAGPATLALRSGAALLAAVVYSGPGRNHTAVISAPFDTRRFGSLRSDVARLTQTIANQFEEYIRRAPQQWHCFQPNWPNDSSPQVKPSPRGSRRS